MFHADEEIKNPWPDGMPIGRQIVYGLLCIACVLVALVFLGAMNGCSDAQVQEWVKARDIARDEAAAARAELAELKTQVETLPEGKIKDQGNKAIAAMEGKLPAVEKKIDDLDKLITGAHAGDAAQVGAGLGGLFSGVPGVGPYAAALGGLAGYITERIRRKRQVGQAVAVAEDASALAKEHLTNLTNVVHSIEYAGPEWDQSHADGIAAIQGPATTAAVREIRQSLGTANTITIPTIQVQPIAAGK